MNILKKIINRIYKIRYSKYFYFSDSTSYWVARYKFGNNSGPGSYGRLAEFKAETINIFLKTNRINGAIEFGCGDGNQLSLIYYKNYIGVDVSKEAIKKCKTRFKDDKTKKFIHTDKSINKSFDLALSLDVIFHLVEDSVFERYMWDMFNSSSFESQEMIDKHVRHRKFSDWISINMKHFKLIQVIENKYTFNGNADTSFADFYIYSK